MDVARRCWTLKVDCGGDLRRVKDWPSDGREPTVAAVREAISSLYGFMPEEAAGLALRYKDEEEDLCTLTEATLSDALWLAASSGYVLRL
eukprot:CAMPEP_0179159138 /NCGR_PEP_ID=MMETSP0796-20121207/77693_1 /TAXON_ID=73915 /ORGANISM="Pyrodinium bahamense, Strain pbaha01" /LENGTH=89 /DNA_ID=CAMNT_0020860875 /DNA_START=54 /DNA_END=319 /DNA_ORIENTATION=+